MISVNRALSELKLITKKIEQKTQSLEVAVGVKSDAKQEFKDEFIKKAEAGIQQVNDLIERRNILKSAIVASNASTTVIIGLKQMTVAQAIERKTSIQMQIAFSKKLREGYFGNKTNIERHNEGISQQADKQAANALSADTEGDKGAAYTAIVDAYKQKNGAELVSVEGIEKTIEKMQDDIDEFESEVDFVLSESNIKTMIDV